MGKGDEDYYDKRAQDDEDEGPGADSKDAKDQRRSEHLKKVRNMDAVQIAMSEMQQKQNEQAKEAEEEEAVTLSSLAIAWFLGKRSKTPVWRSSRRPELETWIRRFSRLIPIPFVGPSFWYHRLRRGKLEYWGGKSPVKKRDGLGVCYWPDPPKGGGESFYGLWQADQPNKLGCFRWFDGDVFLGEWEGGKMQGYGIYTHGAHGEFANDRYEGAYFQNLRQGSGIYFYAGAEGGVYIGEWLHGRMHGAGMVVYPDGEYYLGSWKEDAKHGLGLYVWGKNAGEVAGDKYEGNFRNGHAHGSGRTMFSDGGWHKGRYVLGKMQGHGMMQTAEGWEYIGFWKDDELHGESVCYFVYGAASTPKTVQNYDNGVLLGERPFDPQQDWTDLEAVGIGEKANGDREGDKAADHVKKIGPKIKMAKQAQHLAMEAAHEAKFFARNSLTQKDVLQAWFGLRHKIIPPEIPVE